MAHYNVPDNWDSYSVVCDSCGCPYHLSEGNCDCLDRQREARIEDVLDALKQATVHCAQLWRPKTPWGGQDELMDSYLFGEQLIVASVTYADGTCDELHFTKRSWAMISQELPNLPPLTE